MSKKIQLIKLAKEVGVGVNSLSDTLSKKGLEASPSPNTKLDFETVEKLLGSFPEVKKEIIEKLRHDLVGLSQEIELKEDKTTTPAGEIEPITSQDKQRPAIELKVVGKIDDHKVSPNKVGKHTERQAEPTEKLMEKPLEEPVITPSSESIAVDQEQKVEAQSEQPNENNEPVEMPKEQPQPIVIEPSAQKTEETRPSSEPIAVNAEFETSMPDAVPISETRKDDGIHRPSIPSPNIQFTVVGKIDLDAVKDSTRPPKKSRSEKAKEDRKKRQRIKTNAVDVKAEAAKVNGATASKSGDNQSKANKSKGDSPNNNAKPNDRRINDQHQGGKNKRQKEQVKAPLTDEEVQRQVKENLARLTSGRTNKDQTAKGAKYRKDKRNAQREAAEEARQLNVADSQVLKLTEFVTVSDLASLMDVPVTKVIGTCMSIGLMVSINMRLDAETIEMVAEEFGFQTDFVSAEVVESIGQDEVDTEDDLEARPPIVTVMGHVDHGKTSLLDRLRNTNVIAGEAGGITQHIGAYSLKLQSGKRITFLDTPGHEAFTAMRARGAKITDIAIIIVAADDDVMPQTKEAINHAAAAGVPMVFAINKIDKPGANPDRIREQLAAMNYLVEEWGGKYQCQEISAKQGLNIDELLEKVLLEAELLELKANPNRRASGSVIESSLDKGRGYVATIMVQNGTLSTGDVLLTGTHFGKVKAMFNERNQRIDKAGPSTPVLVLGLDGAPGAGETFNVMDTEQEARSIASKREQLKREQDSRTKKGLTLEELARRRALGNFQEINVIIKGDVDGSIEALSDSLIRLSTEEIQINVIHKGVGAISESDVVLASASSAIIIGFQVRPSQAAKKLADREGVEIRTYSIIYDTIEDIKSAMEGMLSPEIKENIVANLEVRETFKITKIGTVAGCMVIDGKIKRSNKIRLIRDGIVKYAGALGSLKRFKDDVKEVYMGQDCGLNIDGYNDVMVGDIIEAYEEIEVKKTLD